MIKKKSTAYFIIFIMWILTCFYFDIKLSSPIFHQKNIFAKLSIISFLACINLFWLYGFYHLVFTCFSFFLSSKKHLTGNWQPANRQLYDPPIAILYTTMNDFQEECVRSYLKINYPNFKVYILDDSTDLGSKDRIDQFCNEHREVNLIRRTDRKGFKAGNLNHALRYLIGNHRSDCSSTGNRQPANRQHLQVQYEYFAVCDADTILPPDFLIKTIPYFEQDEKIGFVQANQTSNPAQKSGFAQSFGFNTDLHWQHYVPVKERYGFMMFYGHAAVVRTAAWQEVGGFPEIITEDLAFSSLLREKGCYGVFAQDVYCYEDFPVSYRALRKRNRRWLTGTLEYLFKYYPSFFKVKTISWVEKIDVLVSAVSLMLGAPFLLYLLVAAFALPLSQEVFRLHIPLYLILPDKSSGCYDFLKHIQYKIYWGKDFYFVMLVTGLSQILPLILDWYKKPFHLLKKIGLFTYLSLITFMASTIDFLEYLCTKKTSFAVTGAVKQHDADKGERNVLTLETCTSIFLFIVAIATSNIWLFIVGIGLISSPLLFKYNCENRALNIIIQLPFVLNALLLILMARGIE